MTIARRLRSLELPRRGTLAVSALVIAVVAFIALTSLEGTPTPKRSMLGLAVYVVVGGWAALAHGERLPLAPSWVATVTPAALVGLVSWPVTHDSPALWNTGASAFLLLLVALRGRFAHAWLGMGAMSGAMIAWGAATPIGVSAAGGNLVRQVAILVIGSVFVIAIERVQSRLAALAESSAQLAAAEAASRAAETERRDRLNWARELALGPLTAIARDDRLDTAQRSAAALIEAELRDGLRARTLAAEPVTSAARGARERGVEVVLLDDLTSELPVVLAAQLREHIADELARVRAGRVVVRLPPGRDSPAATVLVDGPQPRRVTIELDTVD